jgi:hypothetical protein
MDWNPNAHIRHNGSRNFYKAQKEGEKKTYFSEKCSLGELDEPKKKTFKRKTQFSEKISLLSFERFVDSSVALWS